MPDEINCNCRPQRSIFDPNCPVHESNPKDAEIRDLKRKFAILKDERDHLDVYLHEMVSQVLHRDFKIRTDLKPGAGNGSKAMREIERLQKVEDSAVGMQYQMQDITEAFYYLYDVTRAAMDALEHVMRYFQDVPSKEQLKIINNEPARPTSNLVQ